MNFCMKRQQPYSKQIQECQMLEALCCQHNFVQLFELVQFLFFHFQLPLSIKVKKSIALYKCGFFYIISIIVKMSYNNSTYQNIHQNTRSKNSQKLIQDQNYSHQIFFITLSTLESIVRFYLGRLKSQFNNKMFKNYDKVDYSAKNIKELKSQLQTHIFIFQASRKVFDEQNPDSRWQLPSNYNKEATQKFVKDSIQILKQNKDQQSVNMALDILEVLDGRVNNLYSQKIDLTVKYSESQRKGFNRDLMKHGQMASQQMDQRAEEVKNLNNVNQLVGKINSNGNLFSNQHQQNKNGHQENNRNYGFDQHQQTSMDIQNNQISGPQIQSRKLFLLVAHNTHIDFCEPGKKFIKQVFYKKNNNRNIQICQNEKQLTDLLSRLKNNNGYYILKISLSQNDCCQGYQQLHGWN